MSAGKNNSVVLFFESYAAVAHLLDYCEGFDSRALFLENLSAGLEALFYCDADALELGARPETAAPFARKSSIMRILSPFFM